MRTSNVIVSPNTSPEIDLKAPPGSAAVANTTQTRKNVRIASVRTAGPRSTASLTWGTPLSRFAWEGKMNLSASAAIVAASNCVNQYTAASGSAILRVTTKPNVTAGLKCPPEMCPTAEAITAITSPWARAIGTSWPPEKRTDPTPMKINANVPTNSATARCNQSLDTVERLQSESDRLC